MLLTLKSKSGQLIGQADVSLTDAYNHMAYPVTVDSMNLVTALDHPVLAPMWEAHVNKELSAENTAFYRAARAFQAWAAKGTGVALVLICKTPILRPVWLSVRRRGGGCTVSGYCDNSVRENDRRCHKRGTQAT